VKATPFGGPVVALAQAPSAPRILYAVAENGRFFRSVDGGMTWHRRRGSAEENLFMDVVVDPYDAGTVYATSTNRALFRTRDGGLTWSPIAPDLYVYELAADRAHRGVLFAAEADGLYRSDDGGDSWARAALDHLIVVGVAADPRAADTVFAVTLDGGSRVWKSTDHGTTWTSAAIFVPSRESRFVFDSVRPEILYLFFYEADLTWLLRSSDGGASWSEMSAYGFRDLAVAPDGTLLAATDYGLERSSDGGATWEPPFEPGYVPPGGPPRDALTRILVSSAPGELFAAGAAGIWRSGDNGAGWTAINQGLLAQGAYQVAVSPTGPPDVFALAGIILAGSADQGATWTRLHSVLDGPQPYRIEALDPLHPGTIYGIVHDQAEFPAVSTNGGREWSKLEIPYNCDSGDSICDVYLRTVELGPDGSLFAGGSFYIHYLGGGSFLLRSEDGGQTWESLRPVRGIFDLAVDPGRRDTYHAVGCRGFFQSTDAGVTWQKAGRGLPEYRCTIPAGMQTLAIDARNPRQLYIGTSDQGVFASSDGGATFQPMNRGLGKASVVTILIDPADSSKLYAGVAQRGVFRWNTELRKWTPLNRGLPLAQFAGSIALDPGNPSLLYAASPIEGVFRLDLEESAP